MPEPLLAGQGEQTEQNASTPAPSQVPDQPTIAKQNDDPQLKGLMDNLDIPAELQSRIAASVQTEPLPTATEPEVTPPTETVLEPEGEGEAEADGEEEGEGEEGDASHRDAATKPDKRQKRINRLTRQKAELEAENQALRQHVGGQQAAPHPIPSSSQRLASVADEGTLNQVVAKAGYIMEWCDANADGVTTEGPDGTEKYHDPATVNKWRREAEKTVLEAPTRRDEIRQFGSARQQYDQVAQAVWPELFDKSTAEHQAAAQLLRQYPNIRSSPQANYAAGLVIEGTRSLMARINAANGQQPARQTRDIDPRAFTNPRVPISPHSPEPPSREAKPSSTKIINDAMNKLANDPDGGTDALASAFAALEAQKRTRVNSRSPVRV